MKKHFIFIFIFIFCFNAKAMTQNKFIERLEEIHPFFTKLDLSLQIKKIDQQVTTANQDWLVGVKTNFNNADIDNNLNTISVDFLATKKIVSSGANITFKHSWGQQNKNTNINLDTNNSKLSIDYVHPLLKNASGINDQLNTGLSSINIQISKLNIAEQKEAFILIQLKKFIDLAYIQERLIIDNQRLDLATQELTLVKQKFNMAVIDKVDVLLQEDAYHSAKQRQLQTQQYLNILRYELSIMLDINLYSVKAEFDLYKPYIINKDDLKQYLLDNSRILKIADLNQDLLELQLKNDKSNSKAQFDLKLGITNESKSSYYTNSISNPSSSWNIGLDFSYPIGNIQAKSNITKTQIMLAKAKEKKQEQLLSIYAKAYVLEQKIKYLVEMLELSKAQIKTAKARTVEERRRYNNANSQVSFVIAAQNNEQSANLNYIQVFKNYQESVLNFKEIIDQLSPL
ncbi:TolC family protein [Candidatus Vesicomyidisocius sp. SY067_SCS001]|uniref:TolC family protein n=1 Tax=Candidatus Vesicomyidisocius sp. SY067_SCS001 TaxID=2732590 RepID=UPI001687E493|nr:TolC family protein [Candidatus Vesicomyosocius sp. SY067_SCS001]